MGNGCRNVSGPGSDGMQETHGAFCGGTCLEKGCRSGNVLGSAEVASDSDGSIGDVMIVGGNVDENGNETGYLMQRKGRKIWSDFSSYESVSWS